MTDKRYTVITVPWPALPSSEGMLTFLKANSHYRISMLQYAYYVEYAGNMAKCIEDLRMKRINNQDTCSWRVK